MPETILNPSQLTACQRIKGIYAITPDLADAAIIIQCVKTALSAGIKLIQLRNKQLQLTEQIALGKQLRNLCSQYHATLIANDSLSLAQAIQADGLHIGADDGHVLSLRQQWHGILGVSCYADSQLARNAWQAGADYVAFGAVYPSSTKPHAIKAPLDLFTIDLPIPKVAIGGIGIAQLSNVFAHGADACAMINGLFYSATQSNVNLYERLQAESMIQQCQAAVLQYQLAKPRHLG